MKDPKEDVVEKRSVLTSTGPGFNGDCWLDPFQTGLKKREEVKIKLVVSFFGLLLKWNDKMKCYMSN